MKKIVNGFTGFALACMLGISALADHKDLKEHITISEKVWVNSTEIKPGRYLVRYKAGSGEMMLERNGKVVAQAKVNVIMNEDKFDNDALLTRDNKLTSIRLGGEREELQLVDAISLFYPNEIEYYYIEVWE